MQDIDSVKKHLGSRVRNLRKRHNWSQEEFAHETGIARSFAGAIERGEKDLRLSTLIKLADAFKVPIRDLFKNS
jgi:transcriptional regulator with XRE-family HTH domain